jgi:cobyrinic acid a,c-diamide synthase
LRAVIERYTDMPVFGAIHADPRMRVTERHLGLMPTNETPGAERQITSIAEAVASQVDIERLLAATQSTATQSTTALRQPPTRLRQAPAHRAKPARLRIGIAQDAAFGFYYADDLDAFRTAGATLIPFDTLHDSRLPDVDALWIGGGFPESFLATLSANRALRAEIRAAIDAGMPAYAECGGLMYLARSITWRGERCEMVGAIAADVVMHDKPIGHGYVRVAATAAHPWAADMAPFAAHEFHYSDLEGLGADTTFGYRMERGHGIDGKHDGIIYRNLFASYSHLRTSAGCDWVARFLSFVEDCRAPAVIKEQQRCLAHSS